MKRHVLSTAFVVIAILALVCTAESRAEDIFVSGEILGIGEVVDPGPDLIITPSLQLIAPPWFVAYEITTGFFGPEILVSSTFLVNINTGEGKLFGEVEWEDPQNPGSGFRGPFTGDVYGAFFPGAGGFDGNWTLHGYGIYRGARADIDNYGPFSGEPQVYEGVIHVPDGL